MEIKVTAIEKNTRRNGVAIVNGVNVEIIDAPALAGSEKQVAWAADIRAALIRDTMMDQLTRMLGGTTVDADKLDNAISQINAHQAQLATPIANVTAAKKWIDNRNNGLRAIIAG